MTSYDIMLDWAQALLSDETLKAWIQVTFGRELAVRIGYDAVRSFGPDETPYIVFSPAGEERGPEREEMTFDIGMMLGLVLHDDENAAMLRGIGEDRAMCMMEQYFSPLALEAIQTHGSPDFLPGEMEGQTFPPRDGYCERQMILTVTIPNTFNLRHAPWR